MAELYDMIFGDISIEQAERILLEALLISAVLTSTENRKAYGPAGHYARSARVRQLSQEFGDTLGHHNSDCDNQVIFLEAITALSDESGYDLFWLMGAYGKTVKQYLRTHPGLAQDRRNFLLADQEQSEF